MTDPLETNTDPRIVVHAGWTVPVVLQKLRELSLLGTSFVTILSFFTKRDLDGFLAYLRGDDIAQVLAAAAAVVLMVWSSVRTWINHTRMEKMAKFVDDRIAVLRARFK